MKKKRHISPGAMADSPFSATSAVAYLEPGTVAPDFNLTTPEGRAVRLPKQ